jgi:hypothetical protein
VKAQVLDGLIIRRLFAREAERLGLDKDVQYQIELEQKALVNKRLYDQITAAGNRVTESELQAAYRLLQTEARLRLIVVPEESVARRLAGELEQGAVFESLAVKHSQHASASRGGDMNFVPLLYLDEPLRTKVVALKPGQHTEPMPFEQAWQIARLVETRPSDPAPPPLGEYRQELGFRLKQLRRREMAVRYMAEMRQRLSYNPPGLEILCQPVDSITDAEKEIAVAYKDKAQYVKVSRLLHVARGFPPTLDTATKKYAVRRAIEEDLLYEEALRRGLDKSPDVRRALESRRDEVLYQALYKQEISDKAIVTDADAMDHFRANRQNFATQDSSRVMGMIHHRLGGQRRDERFREYSAELKAKARIAINQAVLKSVKKDTRPAKKPQGR